MAGRPLGPHIQRAVQACLWPTCLASEAEGSKFRIVVSATGTGQRTDQPLTITTETGPLSFVSDKRAGTVERKLKTKDKNKQTHSSRAASPTNKRARAR